VEFDGLFELIAVGNAFHRLDRQVVAARMFSWLDHEGGVALLWGSTPWHGDLPWQQAMTERFEEWTERLGATDRLPAGWEETMTRDPHEQVLRRAGFDYVGRFEFTAAQTWNASSICGFVYSTSFLSQGVLGDQREAFERDVERCLRGFESADALTITASYAYELARKRE
jgi:hypothetical protein